MAQSWKTILKKDADYGSKKKGNRKEGKRKKEKEIVFEPFARKKMYFVLINNVVRLNSVGLYISYN